MNQYEKLIEYIISEQEDKARELFHQIVVEKSREIYENIIKITGPKGIPRQIINIKLQHIEDTEELLI